MSKERSEHAPTIGEEHVEHEEYGDHSGCPLVRTADLHLEKAIVVSDIN